MHHILHIQDSKQARSAQCNLLGSRLERQGHQQVSCSSTSRSAGQQAGTSRVMHMGGSAQTMSGLEDRLSCMWNDVWNDVKTTSSCEEPPHLWVSNYRHYIWHIQDSKQARSAQCNLLGSTLGRQGHQQVSFFPLLPDLLGSKLERPGSPTWGEAPKLCLVLRTG